MTDARLLELWRSVQGPYAELNGPLIRFAALVRRELPSSPDRDPPLTAPVEEPRRLEDRSLSVNRFEVIDQSGRILVLRPCEIELSFQDRDRTLKVFVTTPPRDDDFKPLKEPAGIEHGPSETDQSKELADARAVILALHEALRQQIQEWREGGMVLSRHVNPMFHPAGDQARECATDLEKLLGMAAWRSPVPGVAAGQVEP